MYPAFALVGSMGIWEEFCKENHSHALVSVVTAKILQVRLCPGLAGRTHSGAEGIFCVGSVRRRYSLWAWRWLHVHRDAWEIGAMGGCLTCALLIQTQMPKCIYRWYISLDLQLLCQKGTSLPGVLFQVYQSCVNAQASY